MIPRSLVRPLEPRWQAVLDEVLRPRGLSTGDVGKLAPKVEELSAAYNAAEAEGRRTRLPLEARIAFSFPRDVPKGAGAVRELVAAGALAVPDDRPLRVLDLGAGLGAMTWGLVNALAAAGGAGMVEAILVDEDAEALEAARAIGRAARTVLGTTPITVELTTHVQSLSDLREPVPRESRGLGSGVSRSLPGAPTHDIVLLGQVLSELDPRLEPAVRLDRQAALVEEVLATRVAAAGALVIVEPALRTRTRHLHALRDRVVARGSANVFAPCLHAAACPMLAIETEWCHEDLPVDLPAWTVPLARAAGLRWQGLTFSYLVLKKDGKVASPRAFAADPAKIRFRVVSDLLRSKGKAEVFICGEDAARRRIRRLDRDAAAGTGTDFGELRRGDIVTLTGPAGASPVDDRGRVQAGAHAAIDVGAGRK